MTGTRPPSCAACGADATKPGWAGRRERFGSAVSGYQQPPYNLTLDVDSPRSNVELLSFPFDAQETLTALQAGGSSSFSAPVFPPQVVSFGYVHPGGAHTYPIGNVLSFLYPDQRVGIHGLYMRRHGECEAAVSWRSLFPQVLAKATDLPGYFCILGAFNDCYHYSVSFQHLIAMSYLRRAGTLDVSGHGGFGIYAQARIHFVSEALADVSFKARAQYDVGLSNGLPNFSTLATPQAYGYDCSGTCDSKGDVVDQVKKQLSGAAGTLNDTIKQCMQAPITHDKFALAPESCTDTTSCYQQVGQYLGGNAEKEALHRGASAPLAGEYLAALTNPKNWVCAPVSADCASLTDSTATTQKVCQLKLRATDLVPMPDQVDLVWYPGGLPANPSAVAALYLALQHLKANPNPTIASGATSGLSTLCSGPPSGGVFRRFVRVAE